MHIDHIEIIGFKSFAEKIIISLPKPKEDNFGIMAIVGPNGSGKSNVIDAIAWGLGEQSLKTLRSKNFENIFFSGTGKNQARLAEVSLFFNNEGGELSEFTITRRLFLKNNESEYLINNNKVRLIDITLLLAQANFGQKSYSLVNQGVTDAILKASTQEKQTFFNEATGVEQYIIKQNEAVRKIIKTQENLDNALIALRELTPLLNSLKRQVNKLQKRHILEDELHVLQKDYYSKIWLELDEQINGYKEKLEKKSFSKKEIEKLLDAYKSKIEKFGKEEIDKDYQDKQEKYQKLLELKNDYLKKQAFLEFEIEKLEKKEKEKGKIEIEIEPQKILDDLKKIKDFFFKIKQEKNISKIKEAIGIISRKLENLINCFKENKPKASARGGSAFGGKDDLGNKFKEKEELKKKIEAINEEIKAQSQKLNQFLNEEKIKREKIINEQKEIEKTQNQFNNINNEINDVKIEITRFETKKDDLEKEIIAETGSLEILKDREKKSIIIPGYAGALRQGEPASPKLQRDEENLEEKIDQIRRFKNQLELIGGIDPEIEKEYKVSLERFNYLTSQTSDLEKSIKSLKEILNKLEEKIKNQFKENFSKINKEFDKFFKILFNGGEAKIKLKEISYLPNGEEEKTETKTIRQKEFDIEIIAYPPGKKIKSIEMLSGGEKALTSLALICSVISINKPPFVILDEADAALDEKNSDRFAKILKELAGQTQLILITHNPMVMEIADVLYGATISPAGSTKLISMKLE